MIGQLIFTSAPMGLDPGRTGYCTVARDKTLSQRLVREIERISVLDLSGSGESAPKVDAFRLLKVGSNKVCLLSRIRSAGQDYTNRTNYLAHHLIIDPKEIEGLPSPADILAGWDGWRDEWSDNPRYLDQDDAPDVSGSGIDSPARCITWFQWSGDENNAAIPRNDKSIFRIHPGDEERLLLLFAESSTQLDTPQQAWKVPFTTFLQPNEDAADFLWIGGWPGTAADRIKSAQVVNSFELAPFDDEMADLQLPVEEIPEDPEPISEEPEPVPEEPEPVPEESEPLPEETAPSEPMEPLQEEPVQPEQAAAHQAPLGKGPLPKEVATEVEPARQESQQEEAPQPAAVRAEAPKRPVGATTGQRKLKRYKQTPARAVQAAAKPKKRNAKTYLLIGLAACVMVTLGVTIYHLMNRIDELETQNAQLIEETDDLKWQLEGARKQNEILNFTPPPPQPRPQLPQPPQPPPTRPQPITPTPPKPGENNVQQPPSNARPITLKMGKPFPEWKPNPNQPINLEKELVNGLREGFGKPSGAITQADYNRLVELDVTDLGITDLNGLQKGRNMRALKLTGNQISDLKPLQGLVKLNKLVLNGNNIENVRPLAKLINLTELHLNNNSIHNIEPLLNLLNLTELELRDNPIPEKQRELLQRELPNCEIKF